jgi:hypothetical protein
MLRLFQSCQHHRFHDAIYFLLGELGKDSGGAFRLVDHSFEISDAFRTQDFYGKRNLNPLLHFFSYYHRYLPSALSGSFDRTLSTLTTGSRMNSAFEAY